MIKYQKINGINVDNATSLPSITQSPEGRAMGAVPGWTLLLDPGYATTSSVRNRAAPSSTCMVTGDAMAFGSFPNGADSFLIPDGTSAKLGSPISGCDINPDGFSFFFVISDLSGISGRQYIIRPENQESDVIAPSIAIVKYAYEDHIVLYENSLNQPGQPQRISLVLTGSERLTGSTPSLVQVTASTERGLSIWLNGVERAVETADKRALDFGTNSQELAMFIATNARFGMIGLLNIDLSAPENTGHRRAIERFLMNKYGIPQGAQ